MIPLIAPWISLLVAGCLPLDYTPIENRPFYSQAQSTIEGLTFQPSPQGPLLAGSAKMDITPPVGRPLAGYGGRSSTGIHDRAFTRALVISNGYMTLAILSADLLAITDDLSEAVRLKIHDDLSIPKDRIMVTATHTHSGPGALGKRFWERLAAGAFDKNYFDYTVRQMSAAVREAHHNLRPSTVTSYRIDAGDLVKNRIIPEGPEDPEVRVLVFRSKDTSRATFLINFAAHPTVLRSKNRLLSGDFPGFLAARLEENEGTVALYTSGAVADQKADPPQGANGLERAEKMGHLLARRIDPSPPTDHARSRVSLSSTRIPIALPPAQPKVGSHRRLPAWFGGLLFDKNTEIQILSINRDLLIGIPADVGSEIGLKWKERARNSGNNVLVINFANDYMGYIMPSSYYDQPIHEAAMSFNGPYMAEYLDRFVNPFLSQDIPLD